MNTGMDLLLMVGVGILGGVVNVMAGGGSMLTVPVLMQLGLPGTVANATNRLAVLTQCLAAVGGFRQHGIHDPRTSLKLAVPACCGALVGAWLAVKIDDQLFKTLFGLVMLGIVASMCLRIAPQAAKPGVKAGMSHPWKAMLLLVGIGLFGGLFQAGTGLLIIAALVYTSNYDLVTINAHKAFLTAIYTLVSVIIFAFSGKIDWTASLGLVVGMTAGGWLGSHFSVRGGELWIKRVLSLVCLLLAVDLLGGFQWLATWLAG